MSNLNVSEPRSHSSLSHPKNVSSSLSRQHVSSFKRAYSTCANEGSNERKKNEEFWRKVNSTDNFDSENPFIIVNNFLKEYPKLVKYPKLAKAVITLELISSILSRHIKTFYLTSSPLSF